MNSNNNSQQRALLETLWTSTQKLKGDKSTWMIEDKISRPERELDLHWDTSIHRSHVLILMPFNILSNMKIRYVDILFYAKFHHSQFELLYFWTRQYYLYNIFHYMIEETLLTRVYSAFIYFFNHLSWLVWQTGQLGTFLFEEANPCCNWGAHILNKNMRIWITIRPARQRRKSTRFPDVSPHPRPNPLSQLFV